MIKKLTEFNARSLIGTALGLTFFSLLFIYAKIPTGVYDMEFHVAFGISGFFSAMFGPIAGFLIGFLGHTVSDILQYDMVYWSWSVNSGIFCALLGTVYPKLRMCEGIFGWKDALRYNATQILANLITWIGIAPVLDILLYQDEASLVFTQGSAAAIFNILSTGVIGTALLYCYSRSCARKRRNRCS